MLCDLYEKLNNVFVVGFIGLFVMNLFVVDFVDGGVKFGSEIVLFDCDIVGCVNGL